MSETIFLLNTRTPWEEAPRARHQVAEALAKRHRVYFISANRTGPPGLRRHHVDSKLTVLLPSWPVPKRVRYRTPLINEAYQCWLFPKVRKLMADRPVCVVNFDHTATQIFRYFKKDVIYYCNDYHIRNYPNELIRRYFERCESRVAAQSTLCVGTCEHLRERLRTFNREAFEIRLGAPAVQTTPVYKRTGTIRLGLVGFLDEHKTSLRTLEHLAAIPDVEIKIYGTLSAEAGRRLTGISNITCEGVVQGEALIDALNEVDVGIAPYQRNDGNPGRTPNKLWHYLAAGKPCVVTDLPGIKDWEFEEKFVYRATDPEDFAAKVRMAYDDDSADVAMRRHEFAKQNSWDKRIEEFLEILEVARHGRSQSGECSLNLTEPLAPV